MATDSTNLPLGETNVDAGTDMTGSELDLTAVQLAQVEGAQPIELPKGNQVVLIPVKPGQVIELPTDTTDGLLAKIGPEGNLAIVIDGRTIILQGYVQANEQSPVKLVTNDGDPVDAAEVVAATDPTLDIQTAAGPATNPGDTAPDSSGIFVPFGPGADLGGLHAAGILDPTALAYKLIDDDRKEFDLEEDTGPTSINITFDILGGVINEDDLQGAQIIDLPEQEFAAKLVVQPGGNDGVGNDPFDDDGDVNDKAGGTPNDGVPDSDLEPLVSVATVKVDFNGDVPGKLVIDDSVLPSGLTSDGQPIIYDVVPVLGHGNGIVGFIDNGGTPGEFDKGTDRLVFTVLVDEPTSNSEFHVIFTLYDNIDNTPPDQNGDGAADLLGANEQTLDLPVKITAIDSDGTPLSAVMHLGVTDDIPFFGQAVDIGEGERLIHITPEDGNITHDESLFVQGDADDQSLLDPSALLPAIAVTQKVTDAGFSLPFGDSEGAISVLGIPTPGIAQTQVLASFGADQASKEFTDKLDNDPLARNSIFGELEDRTDADKDGTNDGENEHPFELFMIATGGGKDAVPTEDNLNTVPDEGNLTIEDQQTNATVTWDGDEILPIFLHQIDAHTIVGYVIPDEPQQDELRAEHFEDIDTGKEAVFVINIDDDGVMTFVQYHQINHDVDGPTPADHDDPFQILGEDGTPIIQVRISDHDGDHATQPVNLVIQDDGPHFIKTFWGFDGDSTNPFNGTGLIDEDKIPNGNNDNKSGDDAGGNHTDGTVIFDFGVDKPGHLDIQGVTIKDSAGNLLATIDDAGNFIGANNFKTADGHEIEIEPLGPDGNGVVQWNGRDSTNGDLIFVFKLDTAGNNLGEFDFELIEPLQHPFHDPDLQNNGPQTAYEDNLNVDITVRGFDVDGDWADGHIKISIDDDVPVARNDSDSVVEGVGHIATGNVVTGSDALNAVQDANGTDGTADSPGADRPYVISKLVHDGHTFTLGADGTTVLRDGAPLGGNGTFNGKTLTIPTHEGATLAIVLVSPQQAEVGNYTYTAGEPPHHDSNVLGGPTDTAASRSAAFDTLGEWTASFTAAGITLTPIGGSLAIKDINVLGPNDYRGIGVGGNGDETEVDNVGPDQQLKVGLPALTNNATLQIGALFDGNQFDNGSQEILQWQVFNGAVLVASGQIVGADNGLVSLDIDTGGQQFNNIVLTPIDNGAGDNGNNSDFLLLNVEICSQKAVDEKFDYTLRDADGDESTATLNINVIDTQPTTPTEGSGSLEILVDEDGLNSSGTIKDGIGDHQQGDAEEAHGGLNAATDDAKFIGIIPFTAGADPVTIELTVGNNGDTGLDALNGKSIFAAWDAEEHRLVGYIEGTDPSDAANQIFVVQITNEQTGAFTLTLLQPIKHADVDGQENGDNENIPDPYFTIGVQIEDKDCDVAYSTIKVTIDDDMPVVSISADSAGTTQHDETAGRQTDSGDDDQSGNPPAIFNALGAGPAIGWAHDGDSAVNIIVGKYGADGPGTSVYSLDIPAGNVDSGVDTTDGKSVWLFEGPNGIIVGRAGSGAGGATPDAAGQIIFGISIDSDGELTVVQYDSLKHPISPNEYDEDIGLTPGVLQAVLTLTDADGDSASGSANIGNLVRFDDDGPKAKIDTTHSGFVQHDETAGVQNPGDGSDMDQNAALPAEFTGIVGTLIGWAKSVGAVVSTAGSSTGEDDEGATTKLTIAVSSAGVDSFIDDTVTGQNILLFQNGAIIEGRVGNAAGPVAFAVSINPDGTVNVAQFRALEHPDNPNNFDETIAIRDLAIKAVYTITDGDGDVSTDSVDIGGRIRFDDDGPDAHITLASGAQIVLDESVGVATGPYADPNANDEAGNVANDIGYAKVSGNVLFNDLSTFGTDGPGSKTYELTLSSNGTDSGLDDVATGANIRLWRVSDTEIEGRPDVPGTDPVAFRIDINPVNGEVTISQFRAVEHDNPGDSAATHDESASPEIMDQGKLFIQQTVTDGDDDEDTSTIDLGKLIKFEDDGPVAVADGDSVNEDGVENAIGNVYTGANVTAFGSDTNVTDGVADDAGSDGLKSLQWKDGGGFDGNGQITGVLGTLFVNNNGDYKYVLDNSKVALADLDDGETAFDTFSYVITDKDGDTSTAQLKITINGHTDQEPPTAEGAFARVDEDGLPGIPAQGLPPGLGDLAPGDDDADQAPDQVPGEATFQDATLPVDWHGALNGTTSITLTAGDWSALRTIDGHTLNAETNFGGTLLQAKDSVNGDVIFEVQILDQFTGKYEVRLLEPLLHPDSDNNHANDATDDGKGTYEDNLTVPVVVHYLSPGGSATAALDISVDDDSPDANLAKITIDPQGDGKLIHDETPGVNNADDVAARPAALTAAELALTLVGDQIGYAHTTVTVDLSNNTLAPNAAYGADGPGDAILKLTQANGADFTGQTSNLFDTATGSAILLYTEEFGGEKVVVGRVQGSNEVSFILSLDGDTGAFDLGQYRAIKHPLTGDNGINHDDAVTLLNNGGTSPLLHVTLTLVDEDGDATSKTVPLDGFQGHSAVVFEDDGPTAHDDPVNAAPGTTGTADVLFIVDVSGSMTNGGGSIVIPGVPDFSDDRLGLARFSMRELLNNHPEILNVQFIKFDDNLSSPSSVWLTRADALTYINDDANFVGGGATNYDVALQEAINIYGASARPAGAADQTIVYFLSDGAPNTANDPGGDAGITSNGTGNDVSIAEWEAFVGNPANNITNVFAIGLGSANVGNLEPIAYPNDDVQAPIGDEDRVVIIPDSNITALTQTLDDLLGTVLTPVSGNVTDNDVPGTDDFGAPELVEVVYGATHYVFGSPDPAYDIDLGVGRGSLHIDQHGAYTYTPPSGDVVDGTPFSLQYTIRDGDGDTSTANINIDLNSKPFTDLNGVAGGDDVTVGFIEQTPALIAPDAVIGDDDGTLVSMTVTLTNRPDGNGVESLSPGSLPGGLVASYDSGTGVLTVSGTASVADYQTALRSIVYNNTSDHPDTTSRAVNVVVNDGVNNSVVNVSTITVTPVNDAPDAVAPVGPLNGAVEQTNFVLHGKGLSVSDVDAGSGNVTVTLSVTSGIISVSGGNSGIGGGDISGNNSSSVTLTGTLTELNSLLSGGSTGTINYNANSDNPPASTTLTLHVNDNGNTGGGALTDDAVVTINITPVNDAPNTNNTNASGNEDASKISVSLSGTDPDGSVTQFKITSLPTNGTLFADAGLSNIITINEIVSAATVFFVPTANFNGPVTFQYAAIDNLGLEDASPATASITVNPVADPTAAGADSIITAINNGNAFDVAQWALLANDSDPDGPLSISAIVSFNVTEFDNVTVSGANPVNVDTDSTFDPPDAASFTYTATDGTSSANAVVTVTAAALTSGGTTLTGTANSEIIVDTSSGHTVNAGNGNDIVFGNGGGDTLNGEGGDDILVVSDGNGTVDDFTAANGGTGIDTFRFGDGGSDRTLDLSGGSNELGNIDSIERIDMTDGSDDDTLQLDATRLNAIGSAAENSNITLTVADILPGAAAEFLDDQIDLFVLGDSNDHVDVPGGDGFASLGSATINGINFTIYGASVAGVDDAVVAVQNGVTVG
jgi:VCBS repeat-containing protein